MDDRTFDARVRALGNSANRRAVLGVLAGLAGLGAAGASARPDRRGKARASGNDGRVAICHRDGKDGGRYRKITVSANAVDAHLEQHGDFLYKDCCSDSDCPGSEVCDGAAGCACKGECCSDDACGEGRVCSEDQVCVCGGECCSDGDCRNGRTCTADQVCACPGANPRCYWLFPDGSRWEPTGYSLEQCQQMDSCNKGGGGQSGGGCYAWMDDTLCTIAPPW